MGIIITEFHTGRNDLASVSHAGREFRRRQVCGVRKVLATGVVLRAARGLSQNSGPSFTLNFQLTVPSPTVKRALESTEVYAAGCKACPDIELELCVDEAAKPRA